MSESTEAFRLLGLYLVSLSLIAFIVWREYHYGKMIQELVNKLMSKSFYDYKMSEKLSKQEPGASSMSNGVLKYQDLVEDDDSQLGILEEFRM
jgi:hypothetical protein